jgi:hypothetical protein
VAPLQTGNLNDAFISKLNAAGSALVFSTYLGDGSEAAYGIALDRAGNAYVTGWTDSSGFPTTTGAYQTIPGGAADAFVAKFSDLGTPPPPDITPILFLLLN